jgi:radical SAM superfamily enzyme YgiQ (UPF0313 family)
MRVVTLIRPPSAVGRLALTLNITPPLSVAYLAGSLGAAGHEVHVIDAVGEAMEQTYPGYHPKVLMNGLTIPQILDRVPPSTELLGVSCMFSTEWPSVRALIEALAGRFPGVPILAGGEHPTAAPEHALRTAPSLDACVLGEGEETLVEVARALDEGRPLRAVPGLVIRTAAGPWRTPTRARIRAVDEIPPPLWEATPIEAYLRGGHSFGVHRGRTMPMLATRGCPYRCTFCSSPQMWTTRYHARTPSLVVDEIEGYVRRYGVQNIDFYDLTAIIRKDWILAFCDELRRRRLAITWQLPSGTRSEAIDAEVCDALFRSGCRNISYAPESGSPGVLRAIKKKINLDRLEASMQAAVDRGLNVKANILIGFPGEGPTELWETFAFLARMARIGVHDVSVWTFSPYPGSELFEQLRAAGKIGDLDDDYFADLLSYSDLASAVSWSDQVSSAQLRSLRLLGMALFYSLSFAQHPSRLVSLARNAVSGSYESRLEMSVANLVRKVKLEVGVSLHPPSSRDKSSDLGLFDLCFLVEVGRPALRGQEALGPGVFDEHEPGAGLEALGGEFIRRNDVVKDGPGDRPQDGLALAVGRVGQVREFVAHVHSQQIPHPEPGEPPALGEEREQMAVGVHGDRGSLSPLGEPLFHPREPGGSKIEGLLFPFSKREGPQGDERQQDQRSDPWEPSA